MSKVVLAGDKMSESTDLTSVDEGTVVRDKDGIYMKTGSPSPKCWVCLWAPATPGAAECGHMYDSDAIHSDAVEIDLELWVTR